MKKFLPVMVVVFVFTVIMFALGERQIAPTSLNAQATSQFVTIENVEKAFNLHQQIDIKLFERIRIIEKKLKITPPNDGLEIKKKEK